MAVAIDASSPIRATANATTVTTASFNPPACVLVAALSGDASASQVGSWTMSNNGTALTWTQLALRNFADASANNGTAGLYYAVLSAGRTGMTVTGTYALNNDQSLKLYVVTGADMVTTGGGSSEGSASSTASVTTTSFSATGASSMGFVACNDWQAQGAPTSSDTTFDGFTVSGQISGGAGYKVLSTAGSSSTFTFTFPASGTLVNWVSGEILAASGAPPVAPPYPGLLVSQLRPYFG